MKYKLLIINFLTPFVSLFSQSYIGLTTDNYSGIHGVLANPANVVDSRLKFDLNLFSINVLAGNDYTKLSLFESFENGYSFDDDAELDLTSDNNGIQHLDFLGLSVMFNINAKNSIGIFTRVRQALNINNIDGNAIELFDDGFDENVPVSISDVNVSGTAHVWTELGLTYGRVLFEKEAHFLKAGVTLKILQGLGYASAASANVNLDYDPFTTVPGSAEPGRLESTGTANYSFSGNFDVDGDGEASFDVDNDREADYSLQTTSVGFDFGVVYEWRPDYKDYQTTDQNGKMVPLKHKNKYYLKAGLSVTDIGSLKYDNAFTNLYDLNVVLDKETADGDFEDDIEDQLNPQIIREERKIKLPAALHMNIDWNAYKKLYVNLNTDLSLINQDTDNANRIANVISVTPRFETKWFSAFSPMSVRQYGGFIWGAGLRAGPLFVGSGSILTNVLGKSKTADVYFGLKVPIYQNKLRDRDEDGIPDKYDECPKEAGPKENNGCPLPEVVDTDNDGVEDKDDQCPDVPGIKENNGCPIVEEIPEPVVIPDTDGDGVNDNEDKCQNTPGTAANFGCPEVKKLDESTAEAKEVIKSLDEYARTINFNSGKATFTAATYDSLTSILAIFKEYSETNFEINGYTDSVGSESSNLLLSENRANAVKAYFVENGITPTRLKAVGYGEANPIADNTTREGRQLNRRVEIKLSK